MRLEIIPFDPGHLELISPRMFEAREMAWVGDPQLYAQAYANRGPAYTGVMGEEIMGCAGICQHWRGVGEVWMVTTDLVDRYPLAFHRAVSRILAVLWESMGLHRLQAAIHAEHGVSCRWLKRLGFREEGLMRLYGPDKADYMRMSRVKTCHF